MFLGIKRYINQVNDLWTNPSVENFRIYIGIQLKSLVYVRATEVEFSSSVHEGKKLILIKQSLKICICNQILKMQINKV